MTDGFLKALFKAKVLVLLFGAPWLLFLIAPTLANEISRSVFIPVFAAYLLIAIAVKPRFVFEFLATRGLAEKAVRSVCLGYAALTPAALLPVPYSTLGMTIGMCGIFLFIGGYLAAIYFQLSNKLPRGTA